MKVFFNFIFIAFLASALESAPAQVLIIRHAEKPEIGNSLSLKGRERAAALAPFFLETRELLAFGPPIAIYATAASKLRPSLRPIETVTPLVNASKIFFNNHYEWDAYKRMVDEIMNESHYNGKTVLICWEHEVIPEIARAFKAFQTPGKWQGNVFDRIWQIEIAQSGKITFNDLPQRLLFGDSLN